jgi:predicted nucleic acid-binding protein
MGKPIGIKLLDTNALLQFLVRDNEQQYRQASEWFQQAEHGTMKIVVLSIVIAEACFVLESFYKKSRKDIAEKMMVFVSQRWLQIPERVALATLWRDYEHGLHFVDSFLRAWVRHTGANMLTFDKRLLNT